MENPIELKAGLYEHFKGKKYEVIGVAHHSETMEEMVVYKALYKGNFPEGSLWVRPLKMFQENVTAGGKEMPRFRVYGKLRFNFYFAAFEYDRNRFQCRHMLANNPESH
jgi:hypothetical protein